MYVPLQGVRIWHFRANKYDTKSLHRSISILTDALLIPLKGAYKSGIHDFFLLVLSSLNLFF